jgi:probable F420-dependent oxidoreductase
VEYGCYVPANGPLATPENLTELAQSGERLGYDSVRVGDHIVIPTAIASRHPGSPGPGFPGTESGDWLDSLTLLSFLAARTSTIKLLTSVIVLPLRAPVLAAKILATLDVLSNGRLIVGCGVGWMREEFEALGAPPFQRRGAVSNEYLQVFKELWTSDDPAFQGEFSAFSDVAFSPKPVRKPHPPIWIGGNSAAAIHRAARLGDAWYPTAGNPEFPLATPDQLAEGVERLRRCVEDAGRDPDEVSVAYGGVSFSSEPESTSDGHRRCFTGTPEQIAEDVTTFERLGVGHMMLNLEGETLDGILERMERFAAEVMSLT